MNSSARRSPVDARGSAREPRTATSRASRLGAWALASLLGCSPSLFTVREREASQALSEAEAAQARDLARYELIQSRLFLAKAREAAGEAHYALALSLAERSTESSVRARALSLARASVASAPPGVQSR